ncbi:MAG TPA: LppX_LprAFG lipoprotein [Nocardia sp.]|uniref:LppX_LprAFG lipoprotein n=1 Tax=Nocardia TaxID=1817 RepID=UPI002457990A|nr:MULTISPECIES: LppX_LprAFG lipoprotein [Nocardia]HLS78219.1 LppX_LprAFG lipoprotein [Nocardia sp.]
MRGSTLPEGRSRRPWLRGAAPALLAASLITALVAGCSSSDDSGDTTAAPVTGPLPDAAQIVQESSRTTQTLQSVHLDLEVKDVPNLPVESVSADVTNQPQGAGQAMGEATVRTKPEEPFVDTKFIVVDKTLYTAVNSNNYAPVGPAEQVYDPGVILDKDKGLANVIAQVQNPKAEARETIDGIAVVKVTGTIDGSVIDPVVPRLGEGAGELPITLWIADVPPPAEGDSASTRPSEAASTGDGPNLVRAVVEKDGGTVEVTLSKWAEPVNVVKPAG